MRAIGLLGPKKRYKNRLRVFILAAVSVVALSANADETGKPHQHEAQTHEQNVERMLELLGVPEQVNKAASEVLKIYSAKVTDDTIDPDIIKLVTAYQTDLQSIVSAVLSWNAIKPNYIRSYANRLSAEDVTNVEQFMASPSGQKFFDSQNTAGKEIQEITKHLIEADLAEPLKKLREQLQQGLAVLRPRQNPK